MSIEQEVIAFIAEYISVDRSQLGLDVLINDELGVDGDDGTELLEAFSEKFDVDISKIEKSYFGNEGIPFFFFITYPIKFFFGRRKKIIYSPLPVRILVESAEKKIWVD